ncbi:Fc.00g079240.m01.CDS01 [Cosmosporella sp. VM-42]
MKTLSVTCLLASALNGALAWNLTGVDPSAATCSDQYLNDANSFSKDRWDAAGAQYEFERVIKLWQDNQASATPSDLDFSSFFSNEFNGNDGRHCGDMGNTPCRNTLQCDETNKPAGFLILNSFSTLNQMQYNIWEGLQAGMNEMQNSVSRFQELFSPAAEPKSNKWLSDLLTVIQLVVGVGTAFTWNVGISVATKYASAYDFAAGSVEAGIGFGFTWAKTHLPTQQELENSLDIVFGKFFSVWVDSQVNFLHTLFDGSEEGIELLKGYVNNGFALELEKNIDADLGDMAKESQKMLYAKVLPYAWTHQTKEHGDYPKGYFPMILMTPEDCAVTSDTGLTWMVEEEYAKDMSVCYGGHTFFIGFPTYQELNKDKLTPKRLRLWGLPGATPSGLNGQDWGGLTMDDLVISAYEGYRANGNRNGYENPLLNVTAGNGTAMTQMGVRTPGYVQLPICTVNKVWDEASHLVEKHNIITGELKPGETETFPCGDGALGADELAAFGWS